MSLGVGAGMGVSDQGEVTEELVTKYMTPSGEINGTLAAFPDTQSILQRIISGLTGGTRENGCAIENGLLKDFTWLTLSNTLTEDLTINLLESDDDFADPYTAIGVIGVIPALFNGITRFTDIDIPLVKGKYYKFGAIGDPGITGTTDRRYCYIIDYGTNPTMPAKYVIGTRVLEQTVGFLNAYWAMVKNLFNTTAGNARQPLPFSGTLTKITLAKYQIPASGTWFIHVRRNGVSVWNSAINRAIEIEEFTPNVVFDKTTDDIEIHTVKSLSASNAHFQAAFLWESLS